MTFVFDLDGTICFKGQPISGPILQALLELDDAGREIIFASARPIRDMLPVIDKRLHHCAMIGGNGSLTAKEGKITKSQPFPATEWSKVMNLLEQYHATYLIDGEWDYVYTGPDDHAILQNLDPDRLANKVELQSLDPVIKVLILTSDQMDELAEQLAKLDVGIIKHGHENVLDVTPSGISKWSALKALGIKEKAYIAFGNDANDIPLFEHARHTVMVGEYEPLAPLAKETIPLIGDYERKIADTIRSLATDYR